MLLPFIKKHRKPLLWIFGGLASSLLIVSVIVFVKREAIIQAALHRGLNKLKREYGLNVQIDSAKLEGFKTLHFKNISIVPEHRDSLCKIEDLSVSIKLWPLLFGNVELAKVDLTNGWVNLTNRHGIKNYDFLFKRKKKSSDGRKSLSKLIGRLVRSLINKVPEDLQMRNFELKYVDDIDSLSFKTDKSIIDGGDVNAQIKVNHDFAKWYITGEVDPSDQYFNILLHADKGKKIELPYIEKRFNVKFGLDSLEAELVKAKREDGVFKLCGTLSLKNLLFYHPKVAAKELICPNMHLEGNVFVGDNYVSLDSSSVVQIQDVKINPYVKYTLTPQKAYELSLIIPNTNAQSLFDAVPRGVFETLEGIQTQGELGYRLQFGLDTANPDSVILLTKVNTNNFKIVSYGNERLDKIAHPFVYTPYENGNPVRDILIAPENPNFTHLNEISPQLQHAILTAEDYNFFTHHGFNEEAIRKAIAINFKTKSYKRGGSTISMQLVKNTYLNRQKNLFRKIEEIILVWLIESQHLVPKSRMFEVYLNIVEWGNNVYGIKEAARYYFQKTPAQLNLAESIFLASIVPKPKRSFNSFDADGTLKPYIRNYYNMIGRLMAKRGFASYDTSNYGFYTIRLRDGLRRSSSKADTLYIDEANEIDPFELEESQ